MSLYDMWDFSNITFIGFAIFFGIIFCIMDILEFFKAKKCGDQPSFALDDIINTTFKMQKIICIVLCLLLAVVTLFSSNQFVILLGCDDIRVMPDGTYCYYVVATNENGDTYTLPAKVFKYDDDSYDNTDTYAVENIYFDNGGYLYFWSSDSFEYGESRGDYDQNDHYWDFELTNNKASHYRVKETNPLKPSKLIIPFACALVFLFSALMHAYYLVKHKPEVETSDNPQTDPTPSKMLWESDEIQALLKKYGALPQVENALTDTDIPEETSDDHDMIHLLDMYERGEITRDEYLEKISQNQKDNF